MLSKTFYGVISDRRRGIEIGIGGHFGKRRVILPVYFWVKKTPLVLEVVGAIKPIGQRHAIHMPFTGMIRTIPSTFQIMWHELSP